MFALMAGGAVRLIFPLVVFEGMDALSFKEHKEVSQDHSLYYLNARGYNPSFLLNLFVFLSIFSQTVVNDISNSLAS